MAAPNTLSISFEELVPDGTVRVTSDGLLFAIDLVMLITGKNNNDAGKDLRNIAEETFSAAKFVVRKTAGKGNSKTKLVSFNVLAVLLKICHI